MKPLFRLKMSMRITAYLLLLCILSMTIGDTVFGGENDKSIFSIKTTTANNKNFSMDSLRKNKASVLIFLSESCPICQKYSPALRKLYKDFSSENIAFYGVFPSMFIVQDSVVTFSKKFNIPFTMLIDSNQEITNILKARITPEVFVLSEEGKILYKGRIDNMFPAIGRKRFAATSHELQDALSAVISKAAVQVKETEPIGCFIEFAK
ncbi:MAG: redoxin domain-containing protein [Bacteroidetes bacterium]|nr:redoxin domain-containing protein [Bacteroidota bacterium]